MTSGDIDGRESTTYMGNETDARGLRRDPVAGDAGGGRVVLPGSLHDVRAGSDRAPLGSGTAGREGLALPGDRREDARLDDDRDTRGALAEARRRRLQAGARPQEG